MEKIKTKKNNTLKNKFRFVILNDETFEEKFSLTLTRANVWLFFSTVAVVLVFITAMVIVYTPLKYFIPGFGDYNYRSEIVDLKYQADSLEKALNGRQVWLNGVANVLSGKVDTIKPTNPPIKSDKKETELTPAGKEEKQLRTEVEQDQNFALNTKAEKKATTTGNSLNTYHFFPPLKGYITEQYNAKTNHFGMDIAAQTGTPVMSVLDGTVIASSFTFETGYVIAIQHKDDLVSIYKHNSRIYKNIGDQVKAGDVIAAVGSTGELSSGPHLHFELWYKGVSINPKDYIIF